MTTSSRSAEFAAMIAARAESSLQMLADARPLSTLVETYPLGELGEEHAVRMLFASGVVAIVLVDSQLELTLLVDEAVEERYTRAESQEFVDSTIPALIVALETGAYALSTTKRLIGTEVTFTFECDIPPLMERSYVGRSVR